MKQITLYEVNCTGLFSKFYLERWKAIHYSKLFYGKLSKDEQRYTDLVVDGFLIDLPEEYKVTTANKLVEDLFFNRIDSPEYNNFNGQFRKNRLVYKMSF